MFLAGDIGGTNARLALFESRAGVPSLVAAETYPSRAHAGLKELLLAFRERHGHRLEGAVIGIAGPVAAGRVTTTSLQWADDAVELARVLDVREVVLMNDLEALAWSLDLLAPGGLAELQAGSPSASKAPALARILSEPRATTLPAGRVRPPAGSVLWLVDRAAAGSSVRTGPGGSSE